MHRDTRRLFRRLITRRRSLRICEIDDDGLPWIRCRFFHRGRWEHHALTIIENCWTRVKAR
jgi:hypothetical protein